MSRTSESRRLKRGFQKAKVSTSILNQWIVLFAHFDWLFKLGILFAIPSWRGEGRKQKTEEQILAVNETAVPETTKKATKCGLAVFSATLVLVLAVNLSPKPTHKRFVCNC